MPDLSLKLILDAEINAAPQVKELEKSLKGADEQASKFASGSLSKIKEGFNQAGEMAKRFADATVQGFKAMDISFDGVKEGVGLVYQSFEKLYDLGKEGAFLQDTTDSLARLATNAGVGADLLDQLDAAAGGTVDDVQLAGATIRMLTGETGAMATQLAQTAPELVNIARAVDKLNPTLGGTAKIYEAITLALETGQTRGLKPYGFQIDQNATKQEQLNQILEQGGIILDQVGGNVEKASDQYARFEMAIDNVGDALGTTANQMLNLDGGVTSVIQNFADWLDVSNDIEAAYEAGNITLEQRNELVWQHDYLMQSATDTMTQLETAINSNTGALNYAALATQEVVDAETNANAITAEWADNTFYANQALELQNDSLYIAYTTSEKFADRLQLVNDKSAEMTAALHEAQPPIDELIDTLNQDISSPLSQFIDDLQFFIASGGQDFQGAFEAIKNALASNQISAEEAASFSGELLASIENVKVAAGEITLDEAAQNIASTLNVSLEEALTLLQDVGTAADVLTNVNREISMDTSPLESAFELMMELESSVDNITGTHNVHFNITSSGTIPSTGGGGAPTGGSGSGSSQGFASGTDGFIVPPGYPNDSYMVGLTSGEEVVVRTPAQQQAGGGGGVVIQNLTIYTNASDPRAIAQEVGIEIGRQVRQMAGGIRP